MSSTTGGTLWNFAHIAIGEGYSTSAVYTSLLMYYFSRAYLLLHYYYCSLHTIVAAVLLNLIKEEPKEQSSVGYLI